MNFQQLEYILAVHQHKHFGIAAENCNITQATLSAMIKKLEEEIDVIIFDRSHKPIKTTAIGLEIIEKAQNILAIQQELKLVNDNKDILKGTLKIGIIPTVAPSLLPILLPEIFKSYPELKLVIHEITTEEIIHQLEMDQIDIGILATPLDNDNIEEHILYYEPMLVYGMEKSPTNFITSSQVKDKNIWLLEEGHCFRNQSLKICDLQEKKVKEENLQLEANSFETLINITDKFGGLTLLPELYCNQLSAAKRNRLNQFNTPVPVREISIVTYRSVANAKYIDKLSQLINQLIKPKLSSTQLENKELEIIGI